MIPVFGSIAVSRMFLTYQLENRSSWMVLIFAAGPALTSLYAGRLRSTP